MTALVPAAFFARDVVTVARELLGKRLVHGSVALTITETEAYAPGDTASHGRFGRTPRNAPMWGPGGRAYVYLCYGVHWMLNLSTGPDGEAAAVLIRACEPACDAAGVEVIRARRGGRALAPALLAGPGKVAQALAVDASFNHAPVCEAGGLELREGDPPARVLVGPRVGIGYADADDVAAPWRFGHGESAWISHRTTLEVG